MEEKIRNALSRMAEKDLQLAEKVVPDTIGKAVLALVGRGEALTLNALLAELATPAEAGLRHAGRAAAQKALLAAVPSTSSEGPE